MQQDPKYTYPGTPERVLYYYIGYPWLFLALGYVIHPGGFSEEACVRKLIMRWPRPPCRSSTNCLLEFEKSCITMFCVSIRFLLVRALFFSNRKVIRNWKWEILVRLTDHFALKQVGFLDKGILKRNKNRKMNIFFAQNNPWCLWTS